MDKFSFTLRYRLQERERLATIAIAIVGSVISVITLERAIEKLTKEVKSDPCYRNFKRAIAICVTIEKCPILR